MVSEVPVLACRAAAGTTPKVWVVLPVSPWIGAVHRHRGLERAGGQAAQVLHLQGEGRGFSGADDAIGIARGAGYASIHDGGLDQHGVGRSGQIYRVPYIKTPAGAHLAGQIGHEIRLGQQRRFDLGKTDCRVRRLEQCRGTRYVRRCHGRPAGVHIAPVAVRGKNAVTRCGQMHLAGPVVGEPRQLVIRVRGGYGDQVVRLVVGGVVGDDVVVEPVIPGRRHETHAVGPGMVDASFIA